MWFQKISIPLPQRVLGNSKGEGVLKAKIFKGKFEFKLEFPERGGVQTEKTLRGGSMDIFWNNTMELYMCTVMHSPNDRCPLKRVGMLLVSHNNISEFDI